MLLSLVTPNFSGKHGNDKKENLRQIPEFNSEQSLQVDTAAYVSDIDEALRAHARPEARTGSSES